MPFPPRPRTVITGAGSGLGRELALRFARIQGRLLISDIREDTLTETAQMIERLGGEALAIRADVSNRHQVEALAQAMQERWGGTDILVNNAGVPAGGLVGEAPLEDWEWIMGINLWGVIYGCHYFIPQLKAARRGYILNVASSAGIASLPEMASYNVTKAGVIALSETLHAELAPDRICVTVLCPTFFKTNLMANFRSPTERQRKLAEAMFARARMTTSQVADAALRGLERGEPYVIPQKDGQLLWHLKRLAPKLYLRQLAKRYASGLVERLTEIRERQPS